jgi:HSP20 family protein
MITPSTNRVAAELQNTFGRLNRLIDEAFRGWPGWPLATEEGDSLAADWLPPVDVTEDEQAVRVTAEVPGVRPEAVNIRLENNVLTIRGEKAQEERREGQRAQRYERVYGTFERSFTVPGTVDTEHIAATCEHGVLAIMLPKIEKARSRAITVAVTAGSEVKLGR